MHMESEVSVAPRRCWDIIRQRGHCTFPIWKTERADCTNEHEQLHHIGLCTPDRVLNCRVRPYPSTRCSAHTDRPRLCKGTVQPPSPIHSAHQHTQPQSTHESPISYLSLTGIHSLSRISCHLIWSAAFTEFVHDFLHQQLFLSTVLQCPAPPRKAEEQPVTRAVGLKPLQRHAHLRSAVFPVPLFNRPITRSEVPASTILSDGAM